jgi:peptidoglycan/LPS O-acetylase OafA/YrhL
METTPRKPHLARVDVLRAIAILMVFMHHYWLEVGRLRPDTGEHFRVLLFPWEVGYLGVKLFFVISGFCIHLSYLNWKCRRVAALPLAKFLPTFFWRRFWRIYPPYFIALLFFFWCQYDDPFSLRALLQLSVHAALVQNLSAPFFHNINYSFWSIAVEWQLYAIYPLFLWLLLRWNARIAFALASLVALAINVVGPHLTSSYLLLQSPFAYWFEWTIGALVAHSFVRGFPIFRWHQPILVVLVGWIYVAHTLPVLEGTRSFATTLFFAVLVEWAIRAIRPVGGTEGILISVGLCSYSLYLLHQPYLLYVFHHFPNLWIDASDIRVWLVLPWLTLAPILLVSFGYHRLIESGSIEIGKRLWNAHFTKAPRSPTSLAADV